MTPLSFQRGLSSPAANKQGAQFPRTQLFLRLPDEVLEIVFLEDVLKPTDLCVLALVCGRFGRLIRGSLYNEVEICLSGEKYRSFIRTLSKHPQLRSYVWRVHLTLSIDQTEAYEAMETHYQRARKLLQMLPALRGLQLADFKCSDELASLFDVPMSHLRYLIFNNHRGQSSIHEPTKAISLPQIQRISIRFKDIVPPRFDHTQTTECISALRRSRETLVGTSSLKELTLKTCIDWIALDTDLLKLPRALEKLRCDFGYSGYLTPRATTAALRPLYSTLVFLDLSYYFIKGIVIGRVADFSLFLCLQTLIVDGFLCSERWSSDRPDARCGFYKRLPSTLRTLKVSAPDVNLFAYDS
jgi:hypothetical protein